jgi:hypothetical protein
MQWNAHSFSRDDFNTVSWVNESVDALPTDEELESYLASLELKLHMLAQEYTDQLENAMVATVSTMPRLTSEIGTVENTLESMQNEMTALSKQLNTFDQRNVAGVEDLSRLHTLKTNMQKCQTTLEEHVQWSRVVTLARVHAESQGSPRESADHLEVYPRLHDNYLHIHMR